MSPLGKKDRPDGDPPPEPQPAMTAQRAIEAKVFTFRLIITNNLLKVMILTITGFSVLRNVYI